MVPPLDHIIVAGYGGGRSNLLRDARDMCVIIDELRDRFSAVSHIAALILYRAFADLKSPVKRVATQYCAFSYAPASEKYPMQTAEKLVDTATALVRT